MGEQYTVTAPPSASFLRSSRRACNRPWLRVGAGSTLRVDSARSWPSYKTQTSSLAFLSFPLFSRRRRLNSGELLSSPQRKIAPEKPCPSSACSLRIRPSCCYRLISSRARCSRSSSSRPATSTESSIHRGHPHPVSRCPCLLTL